MCSRLPVDGMRWHGPGYATLSGDLLRRFHELDALFADWASGLGAEAYHFAPLIALADLQPVRYLSSFPHLATLVTAFRSRADNLCAGAAEYGDAAAVALSDERHDPCTQLLTPAACYPVYPMLAGRRLRTPLRLTTRGVCHRRESDYRPLRRQWSFSMREFVCVGDAEAVDWFIDDCRRRIDWLAEVLGIEAVWRPATDPFFDADADPKAIAQRVMPSKRELTLADGLAIASINEHRAFFGEAYDIRFGASAARSACVAFGLERWLWALAARFGREPQRWPDLSRCEGGA